MFERYTEKARRVIFFSRYEASQFGAQAIEAEHILLGLMREDKKLLRRFLRHFQLSQEVIRKRIGEQTIAREWVPTSVDLPLSAASKRALLYASEEADRLRDHHIGTEHLLLGLLREKSIASEILNEQGVSLASVRGELSRASAGQSEAEDSDPVEGIFSLVAEVRNLAAAMLHKCDQIEAKLNARGRASSDESSASDEDDGSKGEQ